MNYKNLKIENFRGIKFLEIEKLGKINLFVGFSHSSKTTVLEAIFLLSGLNRVEKILEIENLRGIDLVNYQLESIIHLLSSNQKSQLSANLVEQKRILTLSFERISEDQKKLNYDFQVDKNQYHSEMFLNSKSFPNITPRRIQNNSRFQENQISFFVHSGEASYNRFVLGELLAQRKKQKIVELLQQIEPKIETFEVLPAGSVHFAMKEFQTLLPFHSMGGGVKHAFSLAVAGCGWKKNMILCIDELENGLHHSTYSKIWNFLVDTVQKEDSQIFITTHSREVIQSFQETLKNSNLKEDCFLYYLQKSVRDGEHRASLYPYDWIKEELEAENEMRGF